MVERSVPGYRTLIANIGPIAAHFLTAGGCAYDLGCSHGAAALAIFQALKENKRKIIAVDNAAAMIDACRNRIIAAEAEQWIETKTAMLQDIRIEDAAVIVLNLTLQFIPIAERDTIIKQLYQGLNPGGACILTEKIELAEPADDQLFRELHENFKRANAYSDLEISQKRKALENVLLRESLAAHEDRLLKTGFRQVQVWFQCLSFISILAIK
jgi:tRNA (cmo5U34)-methyltransferase